jgi:hypothetical protein
MSILALVWNLTKLPSYQVGEAELAIIITEIKSRSKQRFRNSPTEATKKFFESTIFAAMKSPIK